MLEQRLIALADWLRRWEPIWTQRPFVELPAPWEDEHPEVARWLRELSDEQAEQLHSDPAGLAAGPGQLGEWLTQGQILTATEPLGGEVGLEPKRMHRWGLGVPGRKRAQVLAFVAEVTAALPAEVDGWVDWCSGKGHLGRALGILAAKPAHFVERRPALCALAVQRARHEGVVAEAACCDVLEAPPVLPSGAGLAALHACGALGDAAIQAAFDHDLPFLALAPCCHHHQPGHREVPMRSRPGRDHAPRLSPSQLRLATAEETSAAARTRRRRRRKEAYRAGLDLLIREGTGVDAYTRLPPIPKGWFGEPFDIWVERVVRAHDVVLPVGWDPDRAEARGWQRAREAARLSLARLLFRRPLEMLIVLDRAQWLVEQGRRVTVSRFCDRATSPRNLLIRATR